MSMFQRMRKNGFNENAGGQHVGQHVQHPTFFDATLFNHI